MPGPGVDLAKADWLIRSRAVEIVSDFAADPDRPGRGAGFVGLGSPTLAAPASSPIDYSGLFRGGAVDLKSLRALPSLPYARDELKSMQAAFGRGRSALITGDDFTESKVKAFDFAPYSVAAFATHGLTGGEMNGLHEPALVFTPPDRASEGDDGLLTATEIAQLSIEVDWVILSACNSGGGLNSSAPTYSGLARAFRLAGARSLLLSHWQVRDDAATRLTTGTVKGAASGLSRAAALRRAILALMEDKLVAGGSHPAIWAPFILIGD
jgi:CHAT domain-containing protein